MTGFDHPVERSGGIGGLRQRFHATFTPVGQALVVLLAVVIVAGTLAGLLAVTGAASTRNDARAAERVPPLPGSPASERAPSSNAERRVLGARALRDLAGVAMAALQDGDPETAQERVQEADATITCSLEIRVGFLAKGERHLVQADAEEIRREAHAVAVTIARPSDGLQEFSATGRADLFAVMVAEFCG